MPSLKVPSPNIFLLMICLYCLALQVSSRNTFRPGERLNSSAQLVSANGNFTLGFYTPDGTDNSYLAVTYTGDPTHPAWIGNSEHPASKNADPILSIDSSGKLIIARRGGEPIEIYAGGSSKNATATLSDEGNFIIEDMDSNGEVLWQSFDHPTDTLLPGMKLGVNHRTGRNWTLTSWFSEDNPAPGVFALEWDPNSDNLLIRRRGMVYWTSGQMMDYNLSQINFSNEKFEFRVKKFENFVFDHPDVFNFNYNFTNVTSHDEEYFMYSLFQVPNLTPEDRAVFSKWRLTPDGDIFESRDRGTITMGIAMASTCYGYKSEGSSKGCELWEQPTCRKRNDKFVSRSGNFRPYTGNWIYVNNSSLSLSDCRDICWRDCECAAYVGGSDGGCNYWRAKKLEFEQSLDGSARTQYVIDSQQSDKGKKNVIIAIVVTGVALLVFGICLFIVWKIRKGKKEKELQELLRLEGYTENYELENGGGKSDLRLFTYASIQSATNNFSMDHKLGQGGFGPVYKGKSPEGQDIAVKLLSQQSGQGLLEFKTELILISKLQHVNLVKLLGFCIHGNDKMIIYDYVPNKSLDCFLFSPSKRELLDWPQRFNIIGGIAQGLLYLHRYSRLKIIHRDLKPSNILLDENMNPKISDFGLARIFKQNIDEANTERRVGTYGYMAPEYAMQGIFSVKSDVYSFGVLVLEIVSGRKNNSFRQMEGPLNLVEHAWDLWKTDSALQLMDPSFSATCISHQLKRCIHVGLLCVENHAADRPTIEDALSMLKDDTGNLPEPRTPAFITSRRNGVVEMRRTTEEKIPPSANDLTISEMGGR